MKAGRPLPSGYQAAEAKVARARGQQDADGEKVEAMEVALEAGVEVLQEAMDQLGEAVQDLAATRLELGSPGPAIEVELMIEEMPARYQAAEAKVARAQGQQVAAEAKAGALGAALDASVKVLQEASVRLVEAEQDPRMAVVLVGWLVTHCGEMAGGVATAKVVGHHAGWSFVRLQCPGGLLRL